MTPYEVEEIARQRVNQMREKGEKGRLIEGQRNNQSNTLLRTIAAALAILAVIGLVAQNLL